MEPLGGWAVVLVASECYTIPVQAEQDFTVDDIVWYVLICSDVEPDARNPRSSLIASKNPWAVYLHKCRKYERLCMDAGRGASALPIPSEKSSFAYDSSCSWWSGKSDLDVYPRKKQAGWSKVNVFFSDVWKDVLKYFRSTAYVYARTHSLSAGMYNDEASSWLIWLCATTPKLHHRSFAICEVLSGRRKTLKRLTTVAKSLGCQRLPWGRDICELNTLAGRGVAPVDILKDVRTRVDKAAFLKEKAAVCDPVLLRECIRRVINDEITVKPQWGDVETYWTRRWLYTKSGSHTRRIEDIMFGNRLDLPDQPTRREFAEAVDSCVVALGQPEVHAGFSEKEEHGTTRAIYGCDTRSYFTFDYLLRPVEAVWRNRRVLLDPGRRPQSVLYNEFKDKPGYRYMLDFDDYNSQHELSAMRMVIEEACRDAPPHVLQWCIASWDAMFIHYKHPETGSNCVAQMVGTLPSGHRATTFVNTILNAAYCLYVQDNEPKALDSYHCGDDVIIFGPASAIDDMILRVSRSPFRINPAKQSVGVCVGEFLRVAFTKNSAGGYGARAIASMVSGNWVTENRLDRISYVETMVRNLWTICSRFENDRLGTVGVSSLRRRVPELSAYAEGLCTHSISWGGSPVRTVSEGTVARVLRPQGGKARVPVTLPKHSFASDDFLHNHIDFSLLKESGITPGMVRHALRRACVKPREVGAERSMTFHSDDTAQITTLPFHHVMHSQSRADKSYGEAFNVLSQLFSKVHWQRIIAAVRGITSDSVSVTGNMDWPVASDYSVPFSDAMALRKKLSQCVNLAVNYPVRV